MEDPKIRASLRLLVPQIFEALAHGAAVLPLLGEGDNQVTSPAEGPQPAERQGGDALGELGDLGDL